MDKKGVEQGVEGPVTNQKANLGHNDPAGDLKDNTGGGLDVTQRTDGQTSNVQKEGDKKFDLPVIPASILTMRLGIVLLRPVIESGYARRIAKLVRIISLKPVNELQFQFDPFFGRVDSLREALFQVSADRIQRSNPRIDIKTTVVDDRSEPFMRIKFADGGNYKIKTANLTGVQVLEQLDRLILQREPRTWEQTRLPRQRGK